MALNLSSLLTILLHSGRSRCRRMASNAHFVVQTLQPMHLFGSTTLAPQPRRRAVSILTRSSVSVRCASRKKRCASMPASSAAGWRGARSYSPSARFDLSSSWKSRRLRPIVSQQTNDGHLLQKRLQLPGRLARGLDQLGQGHGLADLHF